MHLWNIRVEFKSYVYKLEKEMKSERRKIALVIDNPSGHKIFKLNDVELIFLSSNMTGVLNLLMQELFDLSKHIIYYSEWILDQFDKNTLSDRSNLFK